MRKPQLFCEISDQASGLLGYLAIDRTIDGKACGGIRWGPQVSREEISALSYDMTLKYGFCNIRLGGAKAGIVAPFEASEEERRARLQAFGHELGPLLRSRIYIPGADLGTDHEDTLTILQAAGIQIQDRRHGEQGGYYTGYGVVQAILAALEHLKLSLSDARVAIEGFGKVGGAIGELLGRLGARVVAIATKHGGLHHPEGLSIERLLALRDPRNHAWIERYAEAERITPEDLYKLPVDVLIPCAGPWMINESNVDRIQAKAVVPAANIPATRPIQERLEARGILYLPDFICNAGGILANTLEWRGFGPSEIERFFREVLAAKIAYVLERAVSLGESPVIVAEKIALENVLRMEKVSDQYKVRSKFDRVLRVLGNPHRSIRYLASAYYRTQGPMRRLVAPWAWDEAVCVCQENGEGKEVVEAPCNR